MQCSRNRRSPISQHIYRVQHYTVHVHSIHDAEIRPEAVLRRTYTIHSIHNNILYTFVLTYRTVPYVQFQNTMQNYPTCRMAKWLRFALFILLISHCCLFGLKIQIKYTNCIWASYKLYMYRHKTRWRCVGNDLWLKLVAHCGAAARLCNIERSATRHSTTKTVFE